MDLKTFKEETKLVFDKGDKWGSSMDAWFECAARLYTRGESIPEEWEYVPGFDVCNPESYWHEIFEHMDTDELYKIGRLLHRYCGLLCYLNLDY